MFKRITTTALMLSAPVAVMAQLQVMPETQLASIAGRDSLPSEPFQRVIVMDQDVFLPADGDGGNGGDDGDGNDNGGDGGAVTDGPIVTLLDRKGELLADIAERREQALEERAELLAQLQGPIGQALQEINERRRNKIEDRIDFYENELGDGELDILDVPVEIFTAVLDDAGNLIAVIPESRIELTQLRQDLYDAAGAERLAALAERRLEKLDERREFFLNEVGDGDLDIGEQALQTISLALDSTGQALAVVPQTRADLAGTRLAFYGNFDGPIGTLVQDLTARRIESFENRAEFLANQVGDGELDIANSELFVPAVGLAIAGGVTVALATDIGNGLLFGVAENAATARSALFTNLSGVTSANGNLGLAALYDIRSQLADGRATFYGNVATALSTP